MLDLLLPNLTIEPGQHLAWVCTYVYTSIYLTTSTELMECMVSNTLIGALLEVDFNILKRPLSSDLLVRIDVIRQLPKGNHVEMPIIRIP